MEKVSDSSLERLVPDELEEDGATGQETMRLHLERYSFAAEHLPGGEGLDMACGVGYGTALLADTSEDLNVLGVDISGKAVEYAMSNYSRSNNSFRVSDAYAFESNIKYDFITSFETIEHVPRPEELIGKFELLLKQGGILFASVPVTPSVDVNPYHLTDFSARSFRKLFDNSKWEEVDSFLQIQKFNPIQILGRKEKRTRDLRSGLLSYYVKHPNKMCLRFWSTLRDGFQNRYLTVAMRRK